ncbi:DNA replication/repair protein RecF [bacterium]|nr:DNA replication/repair protein RecF [bacterium]
MYLNKLRLKNFRNLSPIELRFSKINIFLGDNGAGKTSILEAIYFLGTLKSFRLSKESCLINFKTDFLLCSGEVEKDGLKEEIEITYRPAEKRVRLNSQAIKNTNELISILNLVVFSPEDISLITGEPSKRRKFINTVLSQVNLTYLYHLKEYYRVLRQRNSHLRSIIKGKGKIGDLFIWDEELANHGLYLFIEREKAIKEINILVNEIFLDLIGQELSLNYKKGISGEPSRERFKGCLLNSLDIQVKRGQTLTGPHLDEIEITSDDMALRFFGSQGEKRIAAISLKLAQLTYIFKERGQRPILLLDDIFSELDASKKSRIFKILEEKDPQIFITTTHESDIAETIDKARTFKIEKGRINIQPRIDTNGHE